ncbi:zinc fyve domain containing protein [Stagonosporopsis vannaccii]|nr:zinc fyve domain containing protein [Stagonosporopsis vannaccii]
MSDSNSADDDLLARLNALKKSSVSLNTTYSSSRAQYPKPADDLASRFARLGSASPSGSPQPSRTTSTNNVIAPGAPSYLEGVARGVGGGSVEFNEEDEKSLEELLEELNGAVGGRKEWDMSRKEQGDVGKLLKDMRTILPELQNNRSEDAKRQQRSDDKGKSEVLTDWENVEFDVSSGSVGPKRDGGDSDSDNEDSKTKTQTLETDADDVIARIMAELEISKKYDPPSPPPPYSDRDPEPSGAKKFTKDNVEDNSLSLLPSAPTTLKEPTDSLDETQALEDAFTARLAALAGPKTDSLGLPSAPSFAPSAKPSKIQPSYQQKLNEEIETWCIICQDDATLKCIGCDGDLYCRNCWMEGHKGESAGFEERRHRAIEFVKGGDKKKSLAAAG